MAQARNRPRVRLAWLLLLMVLVFLACTVRLAAARADTRGSPIIDGTACGDERDDTAYQTCRDDQVSQATTDERPTDDEDARDVDDRDGEDAGEGDDENEVDNERDAVLASDQRSAESTDDEGLATERLDGGAIDDSTPASLVAAAMTPDWERDADNREAALRGGSSWLGRFDVSVTWRRAWAATDEVRHRQELWLVGTWRL